jgi:predicted nucleic acid-binding protein
MRIISHARYPHPVSAGDALALLRNLRARDGHVFWADTISICDVLEPGEPFSALRVTDLYLLGLAVHNGGKLATLDSRIPAHAVRGGPQALEIIGAPGR